MSNLDEHRRAQSVTYAAVCYQAASRLLRASGAEVGHLLGQDVRKSKESDYRHLVGAMMDHARAQNIQSPAQLPQAMVDAFTLEAVCQLISVGPFSMDAFSGGLRALQAGLPDPEQDFGQVVCLTLLLMASQLELSTESILEGLASRGDGFQFLAADSTEEVLDQLKDVLAGGAPRGTTLQ